VSGVQRLKSPQLLFKLPNVANRNVKTATAMAAMKYT
jgi:hypothetical protein